MSREVKVGESMEGVKGMVMIGVIWSVVVGVGMM